MRVTREDSSGLEEFSPHPLLSFQSSRCSVPSAALRGPAPAAGYGSHVCVWPPRDRESQKLCLRCGNAQSLSLSLPLSPSLSFSYSHIEI